MASEATGVASLAERYAAALFELADEQHQLDPVAALLEVTADSAASFASDSIIASGEIDAAIFEISDLIADLRAERPR